MKKIFPWLSQNFLLIFSLFLLAFIPLYPKLPLLDINRTWVYIRVEDFLVALAWIVFFIHLIRKKATLKTPLTFPILAFWVVGAIATLHGVIFLFPQLQDVFPHIALLHYLRRLEYLSLFFLGFSALKYMKLPAKGSSILTPVIVVLVLTLLAIFIYGIGQRYLGFPAYLTMNEEFAKGVPLKLSALARISSTFAGHYDLAAYLGLFIPLMAALIFAYKKLWMKIIFLFSTISGLILLLMTASRVSFGVYLLSISFLLVLLKKKILIIPVIILSIILMQSFQGMSERFAATITQVDLVVDARTGKAIGVAENYTEGEKVKLRDGTSTDEDLQQGTQYINFPSDNSGKQTEISYERQELGSGDNNLIISRTGEVIVKKAFAYDVSFTTRMQGTWPRAWEAFQRNILFGSGYSSISTASDNNYLRILGETGILGLFSYVSIFIFFFIYCFKVLPHVTDKVVRIFTFGVIAGIVGLMLNATLIDVFEASKVAFVLWLLMGITVGALSHFQKEQINFVQTLKDILFSAPALLLYLVGIVFLTYYHITNAYFVGDDFMWLAWVANCQETANNGYAVCGSITDTVKGFFLHADNFFYRPGTKLYFYFMYPLFELFPLPFHIVSLALHALSGIMVFFIARLLTKEKLFAFIGAALFLILNVQLEAVAWISATGTLIASVLLLFSVLMYLYYLQIKKVWLYILAFLSMAIAPFFQEFAVIGPMLLMALDILKTDTWKRKVILSKWHYLVLLLPLMLYILLRVNANSFWQQGNYNYSLIDLPSNLIINLIGYLLLSFIGTITMPFYQVLQNEQSSILIGVLCIFIVLLGIVLWKQRKVEKEQGVLYLTSIVFFVLSLLPFVGLGYITSRYAYLAVLGIVLFLVLILRLTYKWLSRYNKNVAWVTILLFVSVYGTLNILQIQSASMDWQRAGKTTNDLIVNLNYSFADADVLKRKPVFYFVNVPIKYGEAWVFPLGLEDALWFSLHQDDLTVVQTTSIDEAIGELEKNPRRVRIFEFMPDGKLIQVQRTRGVVPQNEK